MDKEFMRIRLNRLHDVSGVSGTGVVAYGVVWPDGSVTLRWDTQVRSTVMYDSLEDVEKITGHGGHTVIEWIDSKVHIINYHERGWFIEHSDDCRLSRQMHSCRYTIWATINEDAHNGWEHGMPDRWQMSWDDAVGRMSMVPVNA